MLYRTCIERKMELEQLGKKLAKLGRESSEGYCWKEIVGFAFGLIASAAGCDSTWCCIVTKFRCECRGCLDVISGENLAPRKPIMG